MKSVIEQVLFTNSH